jgi:hypothetical protein
MQVEADHRRRGVGCRIDLVDVDREDREDVVMRLARRRAGAAPSGDAEIGAALHCAGRHAAALGIARALGEAGGGGRDVEHDPMPEAAPSGGVGIIDRDCEALGARRRAAPGERRWMLESMSALQSGIT